MALAQRGQQSEALARPALALGAQRALGLQGRDAAQGEAEHARHAQQQIALLGVERRVQARDEQAPGPVAVPARDREVTAPQAGELEPLVAGPRLREGGQRRRRARKPIVAATASPTTTAPASASNCAAASAAAAAVAPSAA